MSAAPNADSGAKFCLCSEPDFCLRYLEGALRERAIAYRREHGAPLPQDAQNDGSGVDR